MAKGARYPSAEACGNRITEIIANATKSLDGEAFLRRLGTGAPVTD